MVKYTSPIDSHVHLRWLEYADWPCHPFLQWAFEDAQQAGLCGLVEIGNTIPLFKDKATIQRRKAMVNRYRGNVAHTLRPVITEDLTNASELLTLINEGFEDMCADKMFCMHSTGDCGVINPKRRRELWFMKAAMNYQGVSSGHFQDPRYFDPSCPFNHAAPASHSLHQTKTAEIVSLEDNIRDASDAGFKGIFEALHTSTPEGIDYLNEMRTKVPFRIVIEVTPAHLFLNTLDYAIHRNGVKMNPALRDPQDQTAVLNRYLEEKVDKIGTDHAGHPYRLKLGEAPPSGMPGVPIWPWLVGELHKLGARPQHLRSSTFNVPNELFFKGKLEAREVEVEYDPSRWKKYGLNPFSRVDGTLKT